AGEDDPSLDIHDVSGFFAHLLRRVDWSTDLHFQTRTTIDTLDYSGHGLNQGSKVVIAAAGPTRRGLPAELPASLHLPHVLRAPGWAALASWRSRGRPTEERPPTSPRSAAGLAPTTRSAVFPCS